MLSPMSSAAPEPLPQIAPISAVGMSPSARPPPQRPTRCVLCPQTLGHLEKAVVLELTLKHVKALTALIEQQQQKILALQSGLQAGA